MQDRITVKGHNGEFGAYVVQPTKLPAPAVVILHEVFGVNADIRHTCSEIADQGFIAIAPEMYWREEVGVNLSVTSEADWQHGLRLNQAFDRDAGARDIRDTAILAASLPGCTGKVAILGYCIGGLMTFLTSARFGADAAVVYHGGDTEKYLDEAHRIDAPLLWHQGEEDEFISKSAQAEIKAALAECENSAFFSYPGQYHAFSRHDGARYNAEAAALAHARTYEFLYQHLD